VGKLTILQDSLSGQIIALCVVTAMSDQGTLTLEKAEKHSSPFAKEEGEKEEEGETVSRESHTLADFGSGGQATLRGFDDDD
jgi:hypothetical protein